jgi:hypothetical protein
MNHALSTMAASSLQALYINDSRKLYALMKVSGLPWYIYNDHCDGYYRNTESGESILVFDMSLNSSKTALVLGGIEIPSPTDLGGQTSRDQVGNSTSIDITGIRAWHTGADVTVDQIIGYLTSEASLSDVLRTVILDVEYSWANTIHDVSIHEDTPARPLQDVSQEGEVRVNVKSLIGAGNRDGTYGECRDNILNGHGSFKIRFEGRTESWGEDADHNWVAVAVEGLEVFDDTT